MRVLINSIKRVHDSSEHGKKWSNLWKIVTIRAEYKEYQKHDDTKRTIIAKYDTNITLAILTIVITKSSQKLQYPSISQQFKINII